MSVSMLPFIAPLTLHPPHFPSPSPSLFLSLLPGSAIPISNFWRSQGSLILFPLLFITQEKTPFKPRPVAAIDRPSDSHICMSSPLANKHAGFMPHLLGSLLSASNFVELKQNLSSSTTSLTNHPLLNTYTSQ